MRGRIPNVDPKVLDETILLFKDEIITPDAKSIVGTTSNVWQKIATQVQKYSTKGIVTASSVRARVALKRGELMEKLGLTQILKKKNISLEDKINRDGIPEWDYDESLSESEEHIGNKQFKFSITFSVEEWNAIKPRQKTYIEKSGLRNYDVLTPYVWSNIIQEHFYLHTKLPCALSFKKAQVTVTGKLFIHVCGSCVECKSIFDGIVEDIPAVNARVVMRCTYDGSFDEKHRKRRRLMGSELNRAVSSMIEKNMAPSVYRKEEANRLMNEGNSVPAQIPNLNSLHRAKHKAIAATRLHMDPVLALCIMKHNDKYGATIRNIGIDKFFVHFYSDLQLKVYKEAYSQTDIPTLCFDATGSCCKKIKRNNNIKSGSIFLYDGVMEFKGQTFTVLSMLSEQHDNISIRLWIQRWLQCGVQPPKVTICDQSLALMSALVQSFTQYNSLEKYLNVCFSLVQGNTNTELPFCYIRNDVNHFMHLITQWPMIKNAKYIRTKQLYARAMGLLIFCTDMREANKILEAIFTIAYSDTDGSDEDGNPTPCAESKLFLKNHITSTIINFVSPLIDENPANINISSENHGERDDENSSLLSSSSFKEWSICIANKCELKVTSGIKGVEDNVQYEREIVPLVINSMKLFPTWSGIMRPIFNYGGETASSSRIESNFNNLKHRVFKNENLPIRVDSFLEKLISFYRGDNLLLQGSPLSDDDDENCIRTDNYGHDINAVYQEIDTQEDTQNICNDHVNSNNTVSKISIQAQFSKNSCIACSNGDFPSGLHKCQICQKAVHLFGCSLPASNTEEGCGEERLCFDCVETTNENSARETWKRKSTTLKSKAKRSASSYLVSQPGFEHLNLNHKGSTSPILFLKNGNLLKTRPLKILGGKEKYVLINTCAIDSLLTVLACSASDSQNFKLFLTSVKSTNSAVQFVLNMLKPTGNKIYKNRLEMLLPKFKSLNLVSGLKMIDVTDTATGMANKLLNSMPSMVKRIQCSNDICQKKHLVTTLKYTVISLSVYGEDPNKNIDIQKELENMVLSEEICDSCLCNKDSSVQLGKCLLVEINAMPVGLHADTSKVVDNVPLDEIVQNYVSPYKTPLHNVVKRIMIDDKEYTMRGVVAFSAPEKGGLRSTSSGHYTTYSYRSNDKWELYDDCKDKTIHISDKTQVNIDLIVFSV